MARCTPRLVTTVALVCWVAQLVPGSGVELRRGTSSSGVLDGSLGQAAQRFVKGAGGTRKCRGTRVPRLQKQWPAPARMRSATFLDMDSTADSAARILAGTPSIGGRRYIQIPYCTWAHLNIPVECTARIPLDLVMGCHGPMIMWGQRPVDLE